MKWAEPFDEPMSLRELTPRTSLPTPSISDERPNLQSRLVGVLFPLCLTVMVACLVGSALLVWLAR